MHNIRFVRQYIDGKSGDDGGSFLRMIRHAQSLTLTINAINRRIIWLGFHLANTALTERLNQRESLIIGSFRMGNART